MLGQTTLQGTMLANKIGENEFRNDTLFVKIATRFNGAH